MTPEELESSKAIERSVVKKLLIGLIPFLALLYMFNMLDRSNVSIAALGFKKELGFSDSWFGFGSGIFYLGYFTFEVPSNLIMERVGARPWIARIMITWGIISAAMMFMRTPLSFCILRILLGIAEAGFFPGVMLYLTYWVPGPIRARVIARFLAMTGVLGILGAPLGGRLLAMNGVAGLHGWQWVFLLEGIPSVLLGLLVLFVLPNGPAEARWLTPGEKDWILTSLAHDEANQIRVSHPSLKTIFADKRVIHLCLIFIITSIGGNAVGFFGPLLIKARSGNLWSDQAVANSMAIPSIVGALAMVFAAKHSDLSGNRRAHVVLGYFVAGLGFLACVYAPSAAMVIVALSLNQLGERCAAGSYWAVTTNLLGVRAAAGGLAFINSVGNLGGFIGPWLMGALKDHFHGSFTPGLIVAFLLLLVGSALSFWLKPQRSTSPIDSAACSAPISADDRELAAPQPEQIAP